MEDDDLTAFAKIQFIESKYSTMSWPKVKTIAFLTYVCGGMGDIITSKKAIDIIQEELPYVEIDWILTKYNADIDSIVKSLTQVPVYYFGNVSDNTTSVRKTYDLMVIAPVRVGWGTDYIERKCNIKISKTFTFYEAAERMSYHYSRIASINDKFKYPTRKNNTIFGLSMGLIPGTGMLIDNKRISLSKSKQHTELINNKEIRTVIKNHSGYSINFGYAHRHESHIKFVQCVAIHEKKKNILIFMNAEGAYFNEEFILPDLTKYDIGMVVIDGEQIRQSDTGRILSIFNYKHLSLNDIMYLQLMSDRLLATGDNTAIESICCFPKLYLYEDVQNGGCKSNFLKQQVSLSTKPLGKLLYLFGHSPFLFTDENLNIVENILNEFDISADLLAFCEDIINNYSFKNIMLSSMKRILYHRDNPEMWKEECNLLQKYPDEFIC